MDIIIDIIAIFISISTATFSFYVFRREQREKAFQTDVLIRAVVPTERRRSKFSGVTYLEMLLVNRSILPTAIYDIELKIVPARKKPIDLIIGKILRGPNNISVGGHNNGEQDEPQLSDTFPVSIAPLESKNIVLVFQTEYIYGVESIKDLSLTITFVDRKKTKTVTIPSKTLKDKLIPLYNWVWLTKI